MTVLCANKTKDLDLDTKCWILTHTEHIQDQERKVNPDRALSNSLFSIHLRENQSSKSYNERNTAMRIKKRVNNYNWLMQYLEEMFTWLRRQPGRSVWSRALRANLWPLRCRHLPLVIFGRRLLVVSTSLLWLLLCTISRFIFLVHNIGPLRIFPVSLLDRLADLVPVALSAHLHEVGGEHAHPPGSPALPPAVLHLPEELDDLVCSELELVLVQRLVREQHAAPLLVPEHDGLRPGQVGDGAASGKHLHREGD